MRLRFSAMGEFSHWVPHLRAAFVLFHVSATLVLTLPISSNLGNRAAWGARSIQADLADWADALGAVGIDVQYTATVVYTDGTTRNVTREAGWESGTGTVAKMIGFGVEWIDTRFVFELNTFGDVSYDAF